MFLARCVYLSARLCPRSSSSQLISANYIRTSQLGLGKSSDSGVRKFRTRTPTAGPKSDSASDSASDSRIIVWHTDCVVNDNLRELLNSYNNSCTVHGVHAKFILIVNQIARKSTATGLSVQCWSGTCQELKLPSKGRLWLRLVSLRVLCSASYRYVCIYGVMCLSMVAGAQSGPQQPRRDSVTSRTSRASDDVQLCLPAAASPATSRINYASSSATGHVTIIHTAPAALSVIVCAGPTCRDTRWEISHTKWLLTHISQRHSAATVL